SKATNIASTVVAVEAMDRRFVLLLGGRHKGEPYTRLGPLLKERCRLVIAYGESGPLVERDLGGQVPLERGTTFDDVVARARRAAGPLGRSQVAAVGVAGARAGGRAAAHSPAPLYARYRPQHQRRAPLGEPRLRDGAALGAGQVRGGGLDRHARREEGRAHPH